jgi:N-acetylglucosaminyldiphosphoundecaprenol N-acetyl-beta-D-mannosaminyltransferase
MQIELLKTKLNNMSLTDTLDKIMNWLEKPEVSPQYMATFNLDYFQRIFKHDKFRTLIEKTDHQTVDGMPLIWIGLLAGIKIKQRVTGSDIFPEIIKRISKTQHSIYIFGGEEHVNQLAVKKIKNQYPDLKIAGSDHSFIHINDFELESEKSNNSNILKKINEAQPDILFICLGSPKAEVWFFHNKDKLKIKVAIGVGASVDFIAGTKKRSPKWMQQFGLEWLYRLILEPKRLFNRYLMNSIWLIYFFWLAIKERISKRATK